jgi:hypothetical protein
MSVASHTAQLEVISTCILLSIHNIEKTFQTEAVDLSGACILFFVTISCMTSRY